MGLRRVIVRNLGVYYMIIACLMFAVTGSLAKFVSKDLPSIEVVFFRNLIGLIIVIFTAIKLSKKIKGGAFWLLMFRGFIGSVALFAFFYNIAHINLAAAFTFSKTSTIWIALIAAIWLKERLSSLGWFAVFLGFGGIILIIQPNIGISKSDLLGVFSGLGAALAYTSARELSRHYPPNIIVLSFMAWGSVLPLVCMGAAEFISVDGFDFLFSKFVPPSLFSIAILLLVGIFGYLFQIYMTKSYAVSKKAGTVATVSYSDVIFTIIIGYFMGDGLPNAMAFFGIMLVILSGILVLKDKK
ncbi:DMT family transporter [Campylobacter sp. 19-13652]|uniref:DMT family transporter n=1 Tax=Campylobacter sp. 19-13652 TaxID=2840180 RepID=UPI001C73FC69|nr:DMT family transporter [Campylobacter sp. 19-13652]BCX79921.1 membrane protein [Campylobacter sp. 19-13652]